MSLTEFSIIIRAISPCKSVALHNGGEPTLNPELPQMIRLTASEGHAQSIRMVSNGLARGPEYYAGLFDCGLTHLEISVDALNEEAAAQLRGGTDVVKLAKNLKWLCECFQGHLAARVTVSRTNAVALGDLLMNLQDLGLPKVTLQPLEDGMSATNMLSLPERLTLSSYLRTLEPGLDIKLDYSLLTPSDRFCGAPKTSPNVTVDGHMTPCCNISYSSDYDYGCLLEQPFEAVWLSIPARKFREVSERSFPELCEGCPVKKRVDLFRFAADNPGLYGL